MNRDMDESLCGDIATELLTCLTKSRTFRPGPRSGEDPCLALLSAFRACAEQQGIGGVHVRRARVENDGAEAEGASAPPAQPSAPVHAQPSAGAAAGKSDGSGVAASGPPAGGAQAKAEEPKKGGKTKKTMDDL